MMLSAIELASFKCFDEVTVIPFAKLTLLTGVNSRGKSTAVQPLLLMKQSVSTRRHINSIYLNGDSISLGRFSDIRSQIASRSLNIGFGFTFSDTQNLLKAYYTIGPDDADDSRATIQDVAITGKYNDQDIIFDPNDNTGWDNLLPLSKKIQPVIHLANWDKTHYISADRLGPQEYHLKHSFTDFLEVGSKGQYMASVLLNAKHSVVRSEMIIDTGVTQTLPDQAAAWLAYLFGEAHLDVQATNTNVILLYLNSDSSPSQLYRPSNIGFGYSYVLPIIVSALLAQPGHILVVENPEAHLHPAAQSRLIQMLVRLNNSGVQVIIESHSDHILNSLRVAVAEGRAATSDLSILYFGKSREKNFQIINIGHDGLIDIENWPEGFFDQTERDFARLLRSK